MARSTPRGHPWAAGAENIVRIVAAEMVLRAGTANSRSVTETQCPPPRFGFVKVLRCRHPGGFDKRILEAPQEAAERARPPGKGREADQSLDRARPAAHGQHRHARTRRRASYCRGSAQPHLRAQGGHGRHVQPRPLCLTEAGRVGALGGTTSARLRNATRARWCRCARHKTGIPPE